MSKKSRKGRSQRGTLILLNREKKITCYLCNVKLMQAKNLIRHFKAKHPEDLLEALKKKSNYVSYLIEKSANTMRKSKETENVAKITNFFTKQTPETGISKDISTSAICLGDQDSSENTYLDEPPCDDTILAQKESSDQNPTDDSAERTMPMTVDGEVSESTVSDISDDAYQGKTHGRVSSVEGRDMTSHADPEGQDAATKPTNSSGTRSFTQNITSHWTCQFCLVR